MVRELQPEDVEGRQQVRPVRDLSTVSRVRQAAHPSGLSPLPLTSSPSGRSSFNDHQGWVLQEWFGLTCSMRLLAVRERRILVRNLSDLAPASCKAVAGLSSALRPAVNRQMERLINLSTQAVLRRDEHGVHAGSRADHRNLPDRRKPDCPREPDSASVRGVPHISVESDQVPPGDQSLRGDGPEPRARLPLALTTAHIVQAHSPASAAPSAPAGCP